MRNNTHTHTHTRFNVSKTIIHYTFIDLLRLICIIASRLTHEMEFDISYTNKEITYWGGMIFLKQMLQKIGFI